MKLTDEEIQELLDSDHIEIYSSYNCDVLNIDDMPKSKVIINNYDESEVIF